MAKVILISGKAGHGKDTFAECLKYGMEKNNKKVLVLHFADLVKTYATMYLGWNGEKDIAGRQLLQDIGNNSFRQFDPDYWARITAECARVMIDYFGFDFVLIPDNRYPNEIEVVKQYNKDVITYRISRYNEDGTPWDNPKLNEKQKENEGEVALDNYTGFTNVIKNYNLLDFAQNAAQIGKALSTSIT
jgi:hypothetical protein